MASPTDPNSTTQPALLDGYPPAHHILRDLHISVEFQPGQRSIVRAPVVPEICTDQGAMRAGIIATLVDVLGGTLSIRTAYPGWIATAELSIQTARRARAGVVAATGSVMRAGRTRVVIEVSIRQEALGLSQATQSIGSGLMTFSRLPPQANTPEVKVDDNVSGVFDFGLGTCGFTQPCLETIGVRVVDAAAGRVELDMSNYVRNSLGSLQGGMLALLGDTAGQCATRAATGKPLTTSDLAIHYLLPGKTGPFRTNATVLRTTADTALTQIDITDSGADEQRIAVVMNTATLDASVA